MSIKNDEFLNLFDKTGKKIKTGELGNDTIEIDGLSKGDKVSQGDYTVGIQNEHEDNSHVVFGVPDFSAVAPVVHVDGVALDKSTSSVEAGKTANLVATVTPENAADKSVTWASDDKTVATVDNAGKITAIKAGATKITVKTTDGDKSASCALTVTAPTTTSTTTKAPA